MLAEGSVGFVAGVDDVPHRLELVPAALDEPKVFDRDQGPQVGRAKPRPAPVAVGGQGLPSNLSRWRRSDWPSRAASIIASWYPRLGKAHHLLQHAPAVRPPVDVAVRENQRVGRRRGDGPEPLTPGRVIGSAFMWIELLLVVIAILAVRIGLA
jgi:hypothetical protein